MKKTLLAVIPLTCLSVSANAEPNSRFNGLHVGIQGGILNSFANVDSLTNAAFATTIQNTTVVTTTTTTTTTTAKTINNQTLSANPDSNDRHNLAAGAINIGFGTQLPDSQIYLGGELSGNIANRSSSVSDTKSHANNVLTTTTVGNTTTTVSINDNEVLNSQTKVKLNNFEFDADLKAGMIVNPETLIYARLGAAFNRMKIESNNTLTINDANGTPTFSNNTLNLSENKNVVGLRAGLGGEYFLTEHLSGAIDYVFTWYGSQSLNGSGNILNTFNGTTTNTFTNNSSVKVHTQSLMLGINYYFYNLI